MVVNTHTHIYIYIYVSIYIHIRIYEDEDTTNDDTGRWVQIIYVILKIVQKMG